MNAYARNDRPQQRQVANLPSVEVFQAEVLPEERKRELFAGLPAHVRPERFERNLVNALLTNDDLRLCQPEDVFREVSKIAALGLYLDPQLGEAYLVVGWNGKKQRKEPQARIGYRGLMKLGRQSGEVVLIYAHEVHEKDRVRVSLGTNKELVHEPVVFGDRGPIIGYYAVVEYANGKVDFEPMSVDEIHAIRERSDGWRAFKDGKIKSTPWATDEVEMAKKTVIRRLSKRIPQSPELADAIAIEDEAEYRELRDDRAPLTRIAAPPPPPAARLAAPPPPAHQPSSPEVRQQVATSSQRPLADDDIPSEPELWGDGEGDERTEPEDDGERATFKAYVAEYLAKAEVPKRLVDWFNSDVQKKQRAELLSEDEVSEMRARVMARVEELRQPAGAEA